VTQGEQAALARVVQEGKCSRANRPTNQPTAGRDNMTKYIIVQTGFDRTTNDPVYQIAQMSPVSEEVYKTAIGTENPPVSLANAIERLRALKQP
jgi:hypothetical protein